MTLNRLIAALMLAAFAVGLLAALPLVPSDKIFGLSFMAFSALGISSGIFLDAIVVNWSEK